jgi:hypothetical protein
MKTTKNVLIAALAGIAVSMAASSVPAQVKGGERLQQSNGRSIAATIAASDAKPMSCPKCQDASAKVPDVTSSGAGARALVAHGVPAKAVVSHLCADCVTTTTVAGLGKHSPPATVAHKCAMCNAGKPSAKGMEGMPGMAPAE